LKSGEGARTAKGGIGADYAGFAWLNACKINRPEDQGFSELLEIEVTKIPRIVGNKEIH
jgi:hypothetical protein